MSLRIGVDVDDVLYPWYKTAHRAVVREHRNTGGFPLPKSWYPYEEYGITRTEWEGILRAAIIDGSLHFESPLDGAVHVVQRLRRYVNQGIFPAGTKVIAVTARGETFTGSHPAWLSELVREQTHQWFQAHGFVFDEVHFTANKHLANLDFLIDDSPSNVQAVRDAGGKAYLLDKTWNQDVGIDMDAYRVGSLREYVTKILEDTEHASARRN